VRLKRSQRATNLAIDVVLMAMVVVGLTWAVVHTVHTVRFGIN